MILYDQNFNFIGMSAETLTFLGYEDLDEFTSMHTDFADLFVKKEGFIHKFENFSWIHYILYSGAANKKAYVKQKNGAEVTVDITIKEVFLTDKYEGLSRVYSVKLINENFTNISKTDVHDKRSKKNNEFSLKKLAKGLDLPEPVSELEPAISKSETEIEKQSKSAEPSDFVLDMPDSSIFATQEETTETKPETMPTGEFILKSPPSLDLEQEEEPVTTHLNLDTEEPAFIKKSEVKADEDLKIDLFAHEESTLENEKSEAEDTIAATAPSSETKPFSFDLFKKSDEIEEKQEEEKSETELFQQRKEELENQADEKPFSFDLLKKDTEIESVNTAHKPNSASAIESDTNIAKKAEEPEKAIFSFDLFKREESDPKSESTDQADETETKKTESDQIEKEHLIDQIKSDIAEIDADLPVEESEKELAAIKLEEMLKNEQNDVVHKEEKEEPSAKLDMQPSAEEKHNEQLTQQRSERQVNTQLSFSPEQETLNQSDSFEQTLKEVFSLAKTLPEESETGNKSNIFNSSEEVSKYKHSVTKEDIKSTNPKPDMQEELQFPELGKLGLSKEEELDFIDEFLSDTSATLQLIQEYLKLDDFDNIKYSLIKISSSAEILHFDQLLEYAQSMSRFCDAKESEKLSEKLNAFEEIIARYKEHFSTIIA
jgi:hypothetical protein